ncbi:MAG: RagB/SusD family nutrient uptake outer membrane protein [Muribaculaceae bacterium]
MKKYNKIMSIVLAGALLAGCNDLDTEPQGSTVTADQKSDVVAVDPSKATAAVTGLTGMLDAAVTITSDHYDFGHPAMMLMLDMRGADMYSIYSGYNWFISQQRLADGLPTSDTPYMLWSYNYKVVRAANSLLATLRPNIDMEATDEASLQTKYYFAQGLAFRAYSYLNLVQEFQFTYANNPQALSVPILTDENENEVAANGAPRATVQEVFDLIIDDLNNAIACLEGNPVTGSDLVSAKPNRFVSVAAAYGLRARANLIMNKWAEAAADAQAAISNFNGSPLSTIDAAQPGFNSLNAYNWIWGINVNETDRCVTTGIVNFPSHMGTFSYGYASAVGAWKWINTKLYDGISTSDVRKGWWLDENGTSANLSAEQQAYCDAYGVPALVQVKFAPYNGVVDTDLNASDIPLMRVEEMYLILAEAQGMQNAAQGAQTLTDFVSSYRDPYYTFTATSSQALQDEVWRQRRIELWGEGFSYFDLLRLNKGIDRRGGGWPTQTIYNISATDPIMVFPIPEDEITANKQINSADNTNGGGVPDPVAE